jgi:hypothetical protein
MSTHSIPRESTEFEMRGYKFRFGSSQRTGETVFSPLIETLCLWRWNGYYWQIELRDCTDIDGAKYVMLFKLDDERRNLRK